MAIVNAKHFHPIEYKQSRSIRAKRAYFLYTEGLLFVSKSLCSDPVGCRRVMFAVLPLLHRFQCAISTFFLLKTEWKLHENENDFYFVAKQ